MKIRINDCQFKVKLAVSEKERQMGMMKKRFDDTFNGMLFIQKNEQHCFWMKNCIIPLDIIFIEDNIITKIHHNCPPCEDDICDEHYCGEGDLVLELMGGTCNKLGINEGDELELFF
jgi:uncharacterized membrane protein (UPF0127 family)